MFHRRRGPSARKAPNLVMRLYCWIVSLSVPRIDLGVPEVPLASVDSVGAANVKVDQIESDADHDKTVGNMKTNCEHNLRDHNIGHELCSRRRRPATRNIGTHVMYDTWRKRERFDDVGSAIRGRHELAGIGSTRG